MTTDIIPFDSKGSGKDMPAHLAALFGNEGDGNIGPRVTINQLSYRGKTFRRVVDGDEIAITRKDPDSGEMVPVSVVNVVVLDHNKSRSRAYYEGEFEEGKNASPKCFSGDGVKPDADVKEPCSATCASCPNAVKGSKITPQGKQTTKCSPFKRVAVMPSASVLAPQSHVPLLLRLAQTSVWDKDNKHEADGWYAWDQYLDMLRAKGVKHTATVETRIKFDLDVAYPKLLFSASRWMNTDEGAAIKRKIAEDREILDGIVNGVGNTDGMQGQPTAAPSTPATQTNGQTQQVDPAAVAAQAATQAQAAAAAQAAAVAKAAQEAAAAAERAKAEKLADLQRQMAELSGAAAAPAAAAATPAPTPAPAAAVAAPVEVIDSGTPANLNALLANWDA